MRYGQRPSRVKRWDPNEFDEAFIVWQGEAPYTVTAEEIEDDKKQRLSAGSILDRDESYWMRFIVDGKLDRDAVLAKKYRPRQLSFIEAEMKRLGWL